ncbi:MAG: type II toxin-antitoxin system PemK/MazF family toxin [Candidatus Absconditabacteria bacterium]|nr:type II toxin-antitoxin system PemK/MazF family toxin [Candidatus Absconditabacteria bacterium]
MTTNINLFDLWNIIKKEINNNSISQNKFCHPGEIRWARIGLNIGNEQNGDIFNKTFNRLVLILSTYGKNSDIVLAIPITKKEQKEFFGFCLYQDSYKYFKFPKNYVIYTQIRAISKKRLLKEVGAISRQDFDLIQIGLFSAITKKGR